MKEKRKRLVLSLMLSVVLIRAAKKEQNLKAKMIKKAEVLPSSNATKNQVTERTKTQLIVR